MKKRTSAFARLFAVLALVAAIAAVFLVVSGSVDDGSDEKGGKTQQQARTDETQSRTKAATYEVKPGDTLTRISAKTGVPVEELIDLNPEVDPQILIAGETLKLR
jgi:LysM repeat protein